MKKEWTYRRKKYEMIPSGYGQYKLNGYHCTDSSIWDWCDDDSNQQKHRDALLAAERFVRIKESEA